MNPRRASGPAVSTEWLIQRRCASPWVCPSPRSKVSLEEVPPSPVLIRMVIFFLESVVARLQIGFTVIVLRRSGTLDDAGRCPQAT